MKYPGEWEIGEATVFENGTFYLINNNPNSRGYAWLSPKFPESNWTTNITFSFPQQNDQINIGIWFTKDFGAQGPIFGGPQTFHGYSVLAAYHKNLFSLEIRENDGKAKNFIGFFPCYEEIIQNSTFKFDFDYHRSFFTIRFNYRILVQNKTKSHSNNQTTNIKNRYPYDFILRTTIENGQEYRYVQKIIFHDRLRIKKFRPYLALTAQNFAVDPVIIESVEFPEGYNQSYKVLKQTPKKALEKLSNITDFISEKNSNSQKIETISK